MNIVITQKNGHKLSGDYRGYNQMGNPVIRISNGTAHRDRPVPFMGISNVIDRDTGKDITQRIKSDRRPTDPLQFPSVKPAGA